MTLILINCYHAEWLIEKNSYLSPFDVRAARIDTSLRRAAYYNRVSRKPCAVQTLETIATLGDDRPVSLPPIAA